MPIYKYVTSDRTDILENAFIRFTQPDAFNDPFECFPFIESIMPEDDFNDKIKNFQWSDAYIEEILGKSWDKQRKKNKNIPTFEDLKHILIPMYKNTKPEFDSFFRRVMTTRNHPIDIINASFIGALNQTIGILSFTETNNNLLMWSHYAFNHTGFVIEFDEKHTFFDQRKKEKELKGCLKQVSYSVKRPNILILDPMALEQNSANDNFLKWANKIFFTKSEHWNYEKEWRMVELLANCENIIHSEPHKIYLFPIPKNCIKKLIFGCRISYETKQKLINIISNDADYSHIKVQQAEMDEQEYKLNFKQFRIN
jgi:hypothetical protein